jgi:hypothetical protein
MEAVASATAEGVYIDPEPTGSRSAFKATIVFNSSEDKMEEQLPRWCNLPEPAP